MARQTSTSRTIISATEESPYPSATRLLVALSLLVNVVLLAIRLALVLRKIDPNRRYENINGSSLPGTSIMAMEVMAYGVLILALIAAAIFMWREDGAGVATLYAIAAFVAIPFVFAGYYGRQIAGYSVSPLLRVLVAVWLLVCGLITVLYIRRVKRFGCRSRMTIIKTTTVLR